jgi:hypothetical protein
MPRKDRRLDGPLTLRSVRSALRRFHFGRKPDGAGLSERELFRALGVTDDMLLERLGKPDSKPRIAWLKANDCA